MTSNQTITGRWNVVEKQRKIHGEWIQEHDFAPGEWMVAFLPNGSMNVAFRAEGYPHEFRTGGWAHDPVADYILFDLEEDPVGYGAMPCEFADGMVFDPAPDGPWLYFFEDEPHIGSDRDTIIARYAHERHKLQEA